MTSAPVAGPGLKISSKGKRIGAALLEILLTIVTLGIGWLIWWIILWGKGQTPAKQLLKMRVVMANENRHAGWGEMALRELVGKSLIGNLTCGIGSVVGAVMMLTSDNAQALWDRIAKTVVVEDPDNYFNL